MDTLLPGGRSTAADVKPTCRTDPHPSRVSDAIRVHVTPARWRQPRGRALCSIWTGDEHVAPLPS
jgi:hypothetical protein